MIDQQVIPGKEKHLKKKKTKTTKTKTKTRKLNSFGPGKIGRSSTSIHTEWGGSNKKFASKF